ncbi:MAG: potassium channel protein [Planctomycetota bacterium]|nr:MAG: potassium channel protein [Planctomycetota bacterium]
MNISLQRVRTGAIVLCALFIAATVGYRLAGRSWLEAVYMVVITISTVGYGEASSLRMPEQLLTIIVIVFGISVSVFTLGGFIQMTMEGEIERTLKMGRTTRAIEKLTGHTILCGFGRMGHILAKELAAKREPFVVIDSSPEAISEAQGLSYLVLLGDATEEPALQAAGVERARTLVTALPGDAANVFITLTSRNLNSDLQIIARGEHQTTEKKLLQAGANRVVLPAAIGALRIAAMITRPSTIELMELVAGQSVLDVEIDEIFVKPESSIVDKTIRDAQTRTRSGLLIVAIKEAQGGMVFNPSAEVVFKAGDTMIAMGHQNDIDRFRQDYGL